MRTFAYGLNKENLKDFATVLSLLGLKIHSPKFEIRILTKSDDIPPNILVITSLNSRNNSFGNFESSVNSLHSLASCSSVAHA